MRAALFPMYKPNTVKLNIVWNWWISYKLSNTVGVKHVCLDWTSVSSNFVSGTSSWPQSHFISSKCSKCSANAQELQKTDNNNNSRTKRNPGRSISVRNLQEIVESFLLAGGVGGGGRRQRCNVWNIVQLMFIIITLLSLIQSINKCK